MRIVQVANYISSDSRAGGPATVALTNHRALLKKAQNSLLLAVSESTHTLEAGVRLSKGRKILPSNDLGGYWSFRFTWQAYVAIKTADVAHLHFGRDLVSLTSALLCLALRKPYFIQPHGMLHNSNSLRNTVIDRLIVKRLTKKSQGAFVLSKQEEDYLVTNGYTSVTQTIRIRNGVEIPLTRTILNRNKVAFVGRMHKIKQPILFAQVARKLAGAFPSISFEMYGPDGGEVQKVSDEILGFKNISYKGSIPNEEVLEIFKETKVLVVPSLEEVFPMVVVEATTRGAAVLVMNDFGITDLVEELNIGSASKRNAEDIEEKLESMLRQDIDHAALSIRASEAFDIESVTSSLIAEYDTRVLASGKSARRSIFK